MPEPADEPPSICAVCGHSEENHSQLSTGCYALPNLGCDCSGFRADGPPSDCQHMVLLLGSPIVCQQCGREVVVVDATGAMFRDWTVREVERGR